jgi:predicted ribosome quality control (RQC) complex YloA/Tae2 family protein
MSAKLNPTTPVLNWQELQLLVQQIQRETDELSVERVIVPERPQFPAGYIKGEWVIRLTGRRKEGCLLFSIRPRHPYIAWIPGKGPKASTQATHSPFELAFSKQIKGAKLLGIEALYRERTVILRFSGGQPAEKLGLVLTLIPAAPEALLVTVSEGSSGWPVIARSKVFKGPDKEAEAEKHSIYFPPDGTKAPESMPIRETVLGSPGAFLKAVEEGLDHEAFTLRTQAVVKKFKSLLHVAEDRIHTSEVALKEAEKEPDWQRYGDVLKNSLGFLPALQERSGPKGKIWVREMQDYATEEMLQVPCEPSLSPSDQMNRFYQHSRRRKRRIEEASSRIRTFTEARERFEKLLTEVPAILDWPALERLERAAQLGPQAPGKAPAKNQKAQSGWLGKSFTSKEGWMIWVGRNKTENLELTFKRARGNDVWMHVRGKPGAHVLIPVQPGKSVSLETLLDAANLVIYYSGGESWGKTEVDYTFKKYVKRIKDSSEASYTHNKTLIIEPDSTRLKRLMATEMSG